MDRRDAENNRWAVLTPNGFVPRPAFAGPQSEQSAWGPPPPFLVQRQPYVPQEVHVEPQGVLKNPAPHVGQEFWPPGAYSALASPMHHVPLPMPPQGPFYQHPPMHHNSLPMGPGYYPPQGMPRPPPPPPPPPHRTMPAPPPMPPMEMVHSPPDKRTVVADGSPSYASIPSIWAPPSCSTPFIETGFENKFNSASSNGNADAKHKDLARKMRYALEGTTSIFPKLTHGVHAVLLLAVLDDWLSADAQHGEKLNIFCACWEMNYHIYSII